VVELALQVKDLQEGDQPQILPLGVVVVQVQLGFLYQVEHIMLVVVAQVQHLLSRAVQSNMLEEAVEVDLILMDLEGLV
jgi:hypothetical protein